MHRQVERHEDIHQLGLPAALTAEEVRRERRLRYDNRQRLRHFRAREVLERWIREVHEIQYIGARDFAYRLGERTFIMANENDDTAQMYNDLLIPMTHRALRRLGQPFSNCTICLTSLLCPMLRLRLVGSEQNCAQA
jgi:hypothetical protein